ncbi:MAG: cation-transporting P-type ATPase [Chloroflexota bacterium]
MSSKPIHHLRPTEVFSYLATSPQGLSNAEADSRLSLYGSNTLAAPARVPLWRNLLGHMTHLMALVLWGAGLLAMIGGQPTLGVVIWIVVLVNGGFSYWQEHRAQQALEALRALLPAYARLLRDGKEIRLPASQIVPGDLLVLAEGDNIPADARLVEEFGLRTNNATLTGEAIPARRTAEASLQEDLTDLERPNLVFAGTSVVSGTGRAVVFATRMQTQFGRIVRLTQEVREEPSLLQWEMRRVTQVISAVAIGIGVVVFGVAISQVGMPRLEAFLLGLGIIVAAVPEGLTPTVTITLAMAVQRLAQRGVLVKKLAILETLGTVSVVCTDKSGTLTQNQMTIREVWLGGQRLSVTGVGYEPKGEIRPTSNGRPTEADLQALLRAAWLCNNSRLNPPTPERPQWTCLGDQTEAAMRVLALKGRLDEQAVANAYPRVHEIPFDARRKRMSTIHRNQQRLLAYVKGAPREVLQLCTHILRQGQVQPLDAETRAAILAANDEYARRALRVLALAQKELEPRLGGFTAERVEEGLTFLGLVGMMDPPRPEVAGAVERCRSGGVRMVMVTGDYGLTAESVARRVGMFTTSHPRILTGSEIDAMSDPQLQELITREEIVFARMAPEHKLRLVSCYQAAGDVVAVIGDGVNDAPALRRADVGIAMGVIGTDVAKEAADVIITTDDFAAIAHALQEGRAVFDNLRKFAKYIFASNVPEIIPFVLTVLLNIPLALQVRQILAIDLGTDLFPALALGAESPEPEVMNRPPRKRRDPLLTRRHLRQSLLWLGMIETALCYSGFLLVYLAFDHAALIHLPRLAWLAALNPLHLPLPAVERLATTVFLAGVVTAQIGNALASRTEDERARSPSLASNRLLLYGLGVEVALIVALVYLPPLQSLFDLYPLPPLLWGWLVLYAPIVYGLDRLRRALVRRLRPQPAAEGGTRP